MIGVRIIGGLLASSLWIFAVVSAMRFLIVFLQDGPGQNKWWAFPAWMVLSMPLILLGIYGLVAGWVLIVERITK